MNRIVAERRADSTIRLLAFSAPTFDEDGLDRIQSARRHAADKECPYEEDQTLLPRPQ